MSKHTPGPWHWDSDPIKGDPLGRVRYQVTTLGKTIAQTYYSSQDKHAEADTRLISAAPDLLEALLFMLDRFEGRTANLFSQRLACTKARDAIAKATEEAT